MSANEKSPEVRLSWDMSRTAAVGPDSVNLIVMARLHATADPNAQRAPLNLSLVLDRSGSMAGDKLRQCKHASRFVVSHLTALDHLSVISFDTRVDVVVPHQPVVSKDRITKDLDALQAGDTTNLSGGWLEGASQVERVRQSGWINRVLLLTDGQANEGVTSAAELVGIGRGLRERGVQTTCIGFGADFAEDLLRAMSDAGGGNFHYIRTAEEAPAIFARELEELLRVAAQNVRLRIAPGDDVRLVAVLNDYPTREVERGLEVDLGDLLAGDEKRVLIQLAAPRGERADRGVSVLTLSFQQVLGEMGFKEISAFVETPQGRAEEASVNPVVWREVLLNSAARDMKQAREEADQGRLDDARLRLLEARRSLEESPFASDADYMQQRTELERLAKMLDTQAAYLSEGRKSLTYSSISLSRSKSFSLGRIVPAEVRALYKADLLRVWLLGTELWRVGQQAAAADVAGNEAEAWGKVAALQAEIRDGIGPAESVFRLFKTAVRIPPPPAAILTTAVDGALARLVSPDLVELHGSVWRGRCPSDGRTWTVLAPLPGETAPPDLGELLRPDPAQPVAPWAAGTPLCSCGCALRPDLGRVEPLWEAALNIVARAGLVFAVGTETVQPPFDSLLGRVPAEAPIIWIGEGTPPASAPGRLIRVAHPTARGLFELQLDLMGA